MKKLQDQRLTVPGTCREQEHNNRRAPFTASTKPRIESELQGQTACGYVQLLAAQERQETATRPASPLENRQPAMTLITTPPFFPSLLASLAPPIRLHVCPDRWRRGRLAR